MWKKKSAATSETLKRHEEQMQELLAEKTAMENELKRVTSKLSSALADCKTKDDLLKKHEKLAHEATADREKVGSEVVSLKQKLDEALRDRDIGEERSTHLDGALKECMVQLKFVRDEQEQRIHDAVMKTSKEFERVQTMLEEKLAETNERLASVGVERTHLADVLSAKEKTIESLNKQKLEAAANSDALLARLESAGKDNSSLKYEIRLLEKEVQIRNEEKQFNRRTAEASHKQHLENVKKIAKLESECQRLRVLVRKRLPGPAALAKMKSEVQILGRDSIETRINSLSEQLCALEEDNKILNEGLIKKTNELQFSRDMYARTATKLLEVELQLRESSKGSRITTVSTVPHEVLPDISNYDKSSCSESCASASVSGSEHGSSNKQKGLVLLEKVGASEMNLMDDFAEMEKLAVVSDGTTSGISHVFSNESKPIVEPDCRSNYIVEDIESELIGKLPCWIQDIIKLVSEHKHVGERNPDEILAEIKEALSSKSPISTCLSNVSGYISWKQIDSPSREIDAETSVIENSNQNLQSDLSKSISKIIKLIEGVSLQSPASGLLSDYAVRVFEWKTSELSDGLQQLLQACYNLMNKKEDVHEFAKALSSVLAWIMDHCFSLEDVSSTRDAIKKHFNWDQSQSSSEADSGIMAKIPEAGNLSKKKFSSLLMVSGSSNILQKEEIQSNMRDEPSSEGRLQEAIHEAEVLTNQLQESDKRVSQLQTELETLRKVNNLTEEKAELDDAKVENENICCEERRSACPDIPHQPESVENKDINSSEVKEEKQHIRPDWEITTASEKLAECQEAILNLGKQLHALASPKEVTSFQKVVSAQNKKAYAAETITTVENPSPSSPKTKMTSQRSTLLERMRAEESPKHKDQKSQKTKGQQTKISAGFVSNETIEALEKILLSNASKHKINDGVAVNSSLAIVPRKKEGGKTLWKKLIWRKKKTYGKKLPLPVPQYK